MAELAEDDGCFRTLASLMGMDPSFELIEDIAIVSENFKIQLGDLVENSFPLPLQLPQFSPSPPECPSPVFSDSLVGKEDNDKQRNEKGRRRWAEGKPEGVVHVRAKRGQATDRHSLAERVRREKINEKMRRLRALVPGCYKEMGMTTMLDEIIKYVRSLQNQIEFLSMKLSVSAAQFDFNLSQIDLAPGVSGDEDFQIQEMNMNELMMKGYQEFGYTEPTIPF